MFWPRMPAKVGRLRSCLPLLWAVLLLGAFLILASEMVETETADLDVAALSLAQRWRASNPAVEVIMRDLSGLGSGVVLTLGTLATIGYLYINRQSLLAVLVGTSMGAGELVVTGLKHVIGRARPDAALAAFAQDGLSFPSGHASMSAVFFLTSAALLAEQHARWQVRVYIIGIAVACAGLIGLSRVALGVHWASDVLAGWMFGAGWAALCFCAARCMRDRA